MIFDPALSSSSSFAAAQISSPKRRGLRRKIRAAQKAAIAIKPLNLRACTIEEIEDVDLEWQKENGTPRGFSMGRVCPQYLAT
jgi:phosphatidylglycerol lysyltransferase